MLKCNKCAHGVNGNLREEGDFWPQIWKDVGLTDMVCVSVCLSAGG